MEKQEISFFKKIKISILNFDGYQDLAAERISKTILYIVLLVILFSFIISFMFGYQFYKFINKTKEYIENNISEIKYENYELEVSPKNNQQMLEIDSNTLGQVKIIINTSLEDEKIIDENINKIKLQENGILILKDRIIIKNEFSTKPIEYYYKDISQKYNINKIDKEEILKILSGQEIAKAQFIFIITLTLYMFIVYISSILIDILLFTILGFIVARIARLRLKYSAIYNIATYSLTLPLILNLIYFIINRITGFTIEYFQIMYTAIASIYVITAILMIKSDVIKKQYELNKIIEEQEKIREELKRKEEERKQQEEQKKRDKEKEKSKKKKEKKEEEGKIGKEPEGDNA